MRSLARALWLVALLAQAARAEPGDNPIRQHKAGRTFWGWLADPHGVEIRVILDKVRENRDLARAQGRFTTTYQPAAAALRARALDDALGMLRYARRLEPENPDVLLALGEIAAERGQVGEAIGALDAYLAAHEKTSPYVYTLLGRLYALQERWDDAEKALETALRGGNPVATWRLGWIYMQRGRLADAIDLLAHSPAASTPQLELALAVAYDRDEQPARAAAAMSKITGNSSTAAAMTDLDSGGELLLFTPAVDEHYCRAMLYEATGYLDDARAEWLAYSRAAPPAAYRARALDHLRAIDAKRHRQGGQRSDR